MDVFSFEYDSFSAARAIEKLKEGGVVGCGAKTVTRQCILSLPEVKEKRKFSVVRISLGELGISGLCTENKIRMHAERLSLFRPPPELALMLRVLRWNDEEHSRLYSGMTPLLIPGTEELYVFHLARYGKIPAITAVSAQSYSIPEYADYLFIRR